MAKRRDITRDELLDEAERLLRCQGYNGFSIRDVGEAVGISSASVHHHFPTKGDLTATLLQRYRQRWNAQMAAIAVEQEDWRGRVDGLVAIFAAMAQQQGPGCLLGIACADHNSLPSIAQAELKLLHENVTGWLARFTIEAKKRGEMDTRVEPSDMAAMLLGTLQGALLLSRIGGLPAFERAVVLLPR